VISIVSFPTGIDAAETSQETSLKCDSEGLLPKENFCFLRHFLLFLLLIEFEIQNIIINLSDTRYRIKDLHLKETELELEETYLMLERNPCIS
jgi:hypothetical protein